MLGKQFSDFDRTQCCFMRLSGRVIKLGTAMHRQHKGMLEWTVLIGAVLHTNHEVAGHTTYHSLTAGCDSGQRRGGLPA